MTKLGLKTLIINADTIATAQLKGDDLWKEANDEPHMIFMAPEQLISKEFGDLVKDDGIEDATLLAALSLKPLLHWV